MSHSSVMKTSSSSDSSRVLRWERHLPAAEALVDLEDVSLNFVSYFDKTVFLEASGSRPASPPRGPHAHVRVLGVAG